MAVSTYHINPKTGNPGVCSAAKGNCPFGPSENHFESKDIARKHYENLINELKDSQNILGLHINTKKDVEEINKYKQELKRKMEEKKEKLLKNNNPFKTSAGIFLAQNGDFLKVIHEDFLILAPESVVKRLSPESFGNRGFYERYDEDYYSRSYDHDSKEHLKSCGVLDVQSLEDTTWSEFQDSFNPSKETHGVKADLTCNCGKIFERRVEYVGTLTQIVQGIINS